MAISRVTTSMDKFIQSISNMSPFSRLSAPKIWLGVWLVSNLILGTILLPHYGESWDESFLLPYGARSLHAYHVLFAQGRLSPLPPDFFTLTGWYGAWPWMLASLAHKTWPQLPPVYFSHGLAWIFFQSGLLTFYLLAKRFLEEQTALWATLLLGTQPLLWGHGFINLKDVSLFSMTVVSLYLGLRLTDAMPLPSPLPKSTLADQKARLNTLGLLRAPIFWGAAGTLGLTAGLRISGWWAGAIVLFLLMRKRGLDGSILGFFYLGAAFAVQTAVWPASWSNPLFHTVASLYIMSHFPWTGKVLFAGHLYPAPQLPRWYLPWLHVIQFTEPAVAFALVGLFLLIRAWPQEKEFSLLIFLWYFIPMLIIIWRRPALYDNGRQLLFLTPPLFLLAGFGWEKASAFLSIWGKRIAALLLLLPGIWALYFLHPYQYVYYNTLVGGTQGAYQRYELDYWATSFQEVARFLKQTPAESRIVVWGPLPPIEHVLGPQYHLNPGGDDTSLPPFYAVILVRSRWEQTVYPQAPEIYRVTLKNGVPLSIIRLVSSP